MLSVGEGGDGAAVVDVGGAHGVRGEGADAAEVDDHAAGGGRVVLDDDVAQVQGVDGGGRLDTDGIDGVDALAAVKVLDAQGLDYRFLLNVDEGEMVVLVHAHVRFLNRQALRLRGVDVAKGDGIEAARGRSGVVLRKADAVLVICAEYIGYGDVSDLVVHRQKANGAVTVLCENAVNLNVGDVATRALVRVERNKVVIARALKVANDTVMAISVEVDAVHIRGDRIAEIEVKNDVFDGKVRTRVNHYGIIGRILDGHIGYFEALDIVEKHHMTKVAVLFKFPCINGIWALVQIVEIPDTALDFKVMAAVLAIGRKLIVKAPETLRAFV